MPHTNDPETMRQLLGTPGTWAVVGLSQNTERAAYGVAQYVKDTLGQRVIPVHPRAQEVFDEPGYASLADISEPIDVVEIFVNSQIAGKIVDEAIEVGAKAVWLQLGVIDNDAAQRAKDAGLQVVMNTCPMIEAPILLRD